MSATTLAFKSTISWVTNTSLTHVAYVNVKRRDGTRERVILDPLQAVLLFDGDTCDAISAD